MSQAVAAELKAQRRPGSIVSISSISGMNTAPVPHRLRHGQSGAGGGDPHDGGRTGALDGIRVNAVAPGVTETPASRTYVDNDPERDRRPSPWGGAAARRSRPGAILFLLSDLSSYITGQTILVDGGLNLKWSAPGCRQHLAVPQGRVVSRRP